MARKPMFPAKLEMSTTKPKCFSIPARGKNNKGKEDVYLFEAAARVPLRLMELAASAAFSARLPPASPISSSILVGNWSASFASYRSPK